MDLTTYVDGVREELAGAAELGGNDARELAGRLLSPLESAFRLALLQALSAAADEITTELAPGRVDVVLRGSNPTFAVSGLPADPGASNGATMAPPPPPPVPEADDGAVSRINFRLPDQLKGRIEQAAARDGLSVNAWLVRAATAAVEQVEQPRRTDSTPLAGQRYRGWAR